MVYSPGAKQITSPTGSERIFVDNGAAQTVYLTAAQIAALAASETPFVVTTISTVGNGVLTAAGLTSDILIRQGPVAAFSDTTDTAAAIIAAFPSSSAVGTANDVIIKNATSFPMTILAGVGVTLPATFIIPPWSAGEYAVQISSATAVTLVHISTNPLATGQNLSNPATTALNTVGAGIPLAAAIAGGYVLRGGIQLAAFTDTTDTAAAIIAAMQQLVGKTGASATFRYINNTTGAGGFPATITGGTGVTVSGASVVPAQSWVEFLVTSTGAAAVNMVGVAQGFLPHSGTVTASAATPVVVTDANVTPGSSIILTYASGAVGATGAFVSAKTAGTSFTIKSVTSDTAVYNYTILG